MKVKQIQWGFYSDALTSYESIKIMLFFFFLLFLPPLHFCPQAGLLLPRRLHRSPINPAVNHALDSSVGLFLCPSVCISLLSTIFHIISWEPLPTFSHSVLLFYQLFISIHASSLINPGFPSCVFFFPDSFYPLFIPTKFSFIQLSCFFMSMMLLDTLTSYAT